MVSKSNSLRFELEKYIPLAKTIAEMLGKK